MNPIGFFQPAVLVQNFFQVGSDAHHRLNELNNQYATLQRDQYVDLGAYQANLQHLAQFYEQLVSGVGASLYDDWLAIENELSRVSQKSVFSPAAGA
ncbi:MAG: hypothetical protein COV52_07810 [Gammaproteobacteria bacterium CG11_big_fil_rev_8_21_14_0_20_46_22]|nr:MAG: hypothetical protein COW05_03890 [Gammaproteobacteria bacterium CG12_big_fil_rev_8_21_14_0_65_46_12]PIR10662.1 MAG: hypothetical protein COV52_07810 [Gammaproteobacteria bacterium CG11_big_fil_rev_8_21_14_0_20_46_22]